MPNAEEASRLTTLLKALKKKISLPQLEGVRALTIDHESRTAVDHPHKSSLKVLNWNINKNNREHHWQQEFRHLLTQHQPDKVFLQEVRLCANLAHSTGRSSAFGLSKIDPGLSWSFAPNFIDTTTQTYSGVLTATRTRHIRSQALVSPHTEPLIKTPKTTLFVECTLFECSENLLAVNTHLINFVTLAKFEAQLRSIEAVLHAHPGAIIFSGDFNTWNSARWQQLMAMANRLGLTAVSFDADNTPKIKNFLRSPPLDHIFYRGFEQTPLTATVVDSVTSSDHTPLIVELDRR